MTENEIRSDERKKAAQELLELMNTSGRVLQPGLWFAATTLDSSVSNF